MFAEAYLLITALFLLVAGAIGAECYNSKKEWENNKTRTNNRNFLYFTIAFGVFTLFAAGALMYAEGKSKGAANYIKQKTTENTMKLLQNRLGNKTN